MSFQLTFDCFPPPSGPLRHALVPWDSELLGFEVYELDCRDASPEELDAHLPGLLSSLEHDRERLVCTKVPGDSVAQTRALTSSGFYPVETLTEISLPLARLTPIIERQSDRRLLRPARSDDLAAMQAIAAAAFSTDRLHLDPNLPGDRADLRYSQWIGRAVEDGEPVFVLEDPADARVVGFFHTREVAPGTVDLSLAAVDPADRNTGAGAILYQAVLQACKSKGYRLAVTRISTNNLPVLNIFARLGFKFRTSATTLHHFTHAGQETNT